MNPEDIDALWEERLAAACPKCGLRTIVDGVCSLPTCLTSKALYHERKPWLVQIQAPSAPTMVSGSTPEDASTGKACQRRVEALNTVPGTLCEDAVSTEVTRTGLGMAEEESASVTDGNAVSMRSLRTWGLDLSARPSIASTTMETTSRAIAGGPPEASNNATADQCICLTRRQSWLEELRIPFADGPGGSACQLAASAIALPRGTPQSRSSTRRHVEEGDAILRTASGAPSAGGDEPAPAVLSPRPSERVSHPPRKAAVDGSLFDMPAAAGGRRKR